MRMSILKKICILFLTISVSLFGSYSVSASSLLEEAGATETDDDHSEDISYSLLRGNNLNYGSAQVSKISSNEVNVYGLTQCHHICDTVYLSLYLERKVNGSYATYKSWDFTKANASQLIKSITVIVPSGYYYRVRGYHAAKDGSKESTTTLTRGVLIS